MTSIVANLPPDMPTPTRGYTTGVKEGFADAVELSNMGLAAPEGAMIRMRKRVASKLAAKGLAYFSGYVRGHELFSLYLTGGANDIRT